MRADALANRARLLSAATAMFCEHGIEASVAEVADAAGIGRATVFRNFPTKNHLIVAVVSELMREATAAGRELLDSGQDDNELVFVMLEDIAGRQQANRALLEAVGEEFRNYPEAASVHEEMLEVLGELLARGQRAGGIRPEVTALDVLALVKGICMLPGARDGGDPQATLRYLELVRAAITTPQYARPLRGRPPHAALGAGARGQRPAGRSPR